MARATWNGTVIAESDAYEVIWRGVSVER